MRLGDIAKEHRESYKGDKTGIPLVGLEHLISGELRFTNYDINIENTFTKIFRKGDILFGRRRAYLKKAAIAEFDGICSGDITVIEAIEGKVEPRLLPFIMQNDALFDFAISRSAGGLSPRVKWVHLADYEFELPSIDEQRLLADKLWAAYNLKEAYKKMIDATDEMVKAQFVEMFGDIPQIKMSDYAAINKGTTIIRGKTIEGDIPVVAGGKEPSCFHNVANRPANTITVSASGAYAGYVNYWRTPIFASDCNTIIPKESSEVNIVFLYKCLQTMQNQVYALQKGGAQPHVYGTDLGLMLIPNPTKEQKILFVKIAQQADKSKQELTQAIDKIDKVIKSLLQ